jgi:pilus assembly protein CpaB
MDTRKVILLIGALIMAGVTAFFARSLLTGASAPQAQAMPVPVEPQGPQVLVATRALPVGTILDPTALKFQPWPKELIENAYFQKDTVDPQTMVGRVVRVAMTAGQPVTQGALVKPGDRGFLAAALGPGMRAVTVPVSATTSVAGFIFPGDRIDLVLTSSVSGAASNGVALKTAETIMRNLRVLATDQRTDKSVGEDGKTIVTPFATVTVEATPKIAEEIAVAQTLGSLSLSLRSLADTAGDLEEAIATGNAKVPANGDAKAEKAMAFQVAARPQSGSSSFVTGADVSRFQRRSVPSASEGATAPVVTSSGVVAPKPTGPVVRIARGNNVTEVSVGGK